MMALLSQTSTHRRADSLDALSGMHAPETSLAVWERPVLPDIGLELEEVGADAFPDVRVRIHSGKARDELAGLISSQAMTLYRHSLPGLPI